MKFDCTIIFLAFGAFVVTADQEKKIQVSKPTVHPPPPPLFTLSNQIDDIAKSTNSKLLIFEKNIDTRMKSEKKNFYLYVSNIKTLAISKEAKEREEAKQEAKSNEENIEYCIRNEQERFKNDLDDGFDKAVECLEKFTKMAKNNALKARSNFFVESLYQSTYTHDMRNKWKTCRPGGGYIDCLHRVSKEINERISLTRKVSKQQIQISKAVDSTHKENVKICPVILHKYINKRQIQRAKTLKECTCTDKVQNLGI